VKRWSVRLAVVLTALLCLGVAGYVGQTRRGERIASLFVDTYGAYPPTWNRNACPEPSVSDVVWRWRRCPWYGECVNVPLQSGTNYTWVPRSAYLAYAVKITGLDLGNDPSAWEVWFQTHPNLVWDERLKRLVEPRPEEIKR